MCAVVAALPGISTASSTSWTPTAQTSSASPTTRRTHRAQLVAEDEDPVRPGRLHLHRQSLRRHPDGLPQPRGHRLRPTVWSPDGMRIALASSVGSRSTNVFTANPDGSDFTLLTDYDGPDQEPTWSPDGRKIEAMDRTAATRRSWRTLARWTPRRTGRRSLRRLPRPSSAAGGRSPRRPAAGAPGDSPGPSGSPGRPGRRAAARSRRPRPPPRGRAPGRAGRWR